MTDLFTPLKLGDIELANRVVMAPMTRSRATDDEELVTDLHVEYYRQRASAGLIITEGTQPSAVGKGYCRTPGIYTPQQVTAWRRVTDAVHADGGKIVCQLMHVGRVAHPDNKAADAETVAPSAIAANAELYTEGGMKPCVMPRALRGDEIPALIDEYRHATACAMEAGFDGVELHCTSGYLVAQFLSTGSNQRDDEWGGDAVGRSRFGVEVLRAISAEAGAGRVGFRICPGNPFNDLHDDDPANTFAAFLAAADGLNLAWLHVIRMSATGLDNIALAQRHYRGALIVNDSYDVEEGNAAVASGAAAAVSFARDFIANPDLVRRMREGLPLAKLNPATLYTPGAAGYTDYPAL